MNKAGFDGLPAAELKQVRTPALKVASAARPARSISADSLTQVSDRLTIDASILETTPRAVFVSYMSGGLIHVGLDNRCAFVFPIEHVEVLSSARALDLRQAWIESEGLVLHWPRLQVRLSLPMLMRGVFGSADWMRRRSPKRLPQDGHAESVVPTLRKSRVPMPTTSG